MDRRPPIPSICRPSRLPRRALLRAGVLGPLGLGLPAWLAAQGTESSPRGPFGRAKRCILLFLTGGPPQHDTWDPKPQAPAEIRGEFSPIATRIPGVHFGELFPRLAERADRLCVVRSVAHTDTVHTSAGYSLLTGAYHRTPNLATATLIQPSPEDHPHLGAIVSLQQRQRRTQDRPARHQRTDQPAANGAMPPFVVLPEVIRDAGVNTFPGQTAGFLGREHDPLLIEANDTRDGFRPPEVVLPPGWPLERVAARQHLAQILDQGAQGLNDSTSVADYQMFQRQAFDVLCSPAAQQAFDLSQENPATRAAYGEHLFGRGCLLARRLVAAGVSLATVYWHYEGPEDSPVWDTHWNNFRHLRERLAPPADQAIAALVDDLHAQGLWEDTLLVCLGEFGRTPRINRYAGRDHWPRAQSILLAGGMVPCGSVYGATDPQGGDPVRGLVTPPDLAATLLHWLGIPHDLPLTDRQGRTIGATAGTPVAGLMA